MWIMCSKYMFVFTDRQDRASVHDVLQVHVCLHWQTWQDQCALCAPSTCVSSQTYLIKPVCMMSFKYMCVFTDRPDKASVHYMLPVLLCFHWQTWQGQCELCAPTYCVFSLTDMTGPVWIMCFQYMCVFTNRHDRPSLYYVLPVHVCLHWQTWQGHWWLCSISTCVFSLTDMTRPMCISCSKYMCVFTDRYDRASVHYADCIDKCGREEVARPQPPISGEESRT